VASQTCEQCGAKVPGDEQFCPSCGTFMDPMTTPAPHSRPRGSRSSGEVISVSSDGPGPGDSYEEFSLDSEPPAEGEAPVTDGGSGTKSITCPTCGATNPANNRHCQECGARISQGPLPTAPRPAVQATAGVRAALAISGLLLAVILIALFVNIFTGDGSSPSESTTTTSTTVPQIQQPEAIDVLSVSCEPPGIGSLLCPNLISGNLGQGNEYQVSWEETANDGVKITFTFREPIAISEIEWSNIEDTTRFRQNYRAMGLVIVAQDSLVETPVTLQDLPGTQLIQYPALSTTTLEITVVSAYEAEVVDENRFDELAIDEIVIIGRPVTPTTNTGSDSTTSTTSE